MTDRQKIMSDLEGLTFDDWHMFHCDTDVQGTAIDALELLKHDEQIIESLQNTINKLTKALAEKPEQKHGHWVFDPDGMDWNIPAWKCSKCDCRNDNIPPNLERTNPLRWSGSKYCPNCGAKMDEEVKQDD